MNFLRGDFRKVRTSFLAHLLLMTLGGLFAWRANMAFDVAQRDFESAKDHADSITGQLARFRLNETGIRQNTARFLSISGNGAGNEARRLEWIELLKAIHEKRRLIKMQYEFHTPHWLEDEPIGKAAFLVNPMRLRLDLLHEEDLTRFLQDLRALAPVLIRIRTCHLSRRLVPPTSAESDSSLHAECLIDWITLGERRHEEENHRAH